MYEDLTNKKIGRWLCLEKTTKGSHSAYKCICDCGIERIVYTHLLIGKQRKSLSCGCLQKEIASKIFIKHGHNKGGKKTTRTYNSWHAMLQRCTNNNHQKYNDYGGRGITVCGRWKKFELFLEDMGECPECFELDRIDVNGNYEKDNCRWADEFNQSFNKRTYKTNTSGRKGVRKSRNGNFYATINFKNQKHHLGTFSTFEEAVKSREEAELKYFGKVLTDKEV